MSDQECFSFFNPPDEEGLKKTTDNWTRALLKLAIAIPDSGVTPADSAVSS